MGNESYLTATPHGLLSVCTGGCVVNAPVEGVIAYCERFAELRFVTNIQVSSLRIAMEVGYDYFRSGGLSAVRLPVASADLVWARLRSPAV